MEATQNMRAATACTRCGAMTSAGAPDGLCSRCFLEGAIAAGPQPASADADRIAAALPGYEILQEEGAGLYRARDREALRVVALHIVRDPVADFTARARALKDIDHPHLPRVHDVGEREGIRYIVSDYVEGRRLSEVRLQPREALRVVEQVSAAVGHAWDRGVLLGPLPADAIRIDGQGDARIARLFLSDGRRDLTALADALHAALAGEASPAPEAPAPEAPAPEPQAPRPRRHAAVAALDRPSLFVAAAGAVIFVTGLLPWAGYSQGTMSGWANGWETTLWSFPMWLLLAAGIVLGGLGFLRRLGTVDVSWKVFAVGGIIAILTMVTWLSVFLSIDVPSGVSLRIGPGGPFTLLAFVTILVSALQMRPAAPATRLGPRRRDPPRRRRP